MDGVNRGSEGIYASLQSSSQNSPMSQYSEHTLPHQSAMNKSLGLTHLPGSQLQQNSSLLSETKFDLDGCGQLSTFPILSRDTRSERHDLNVLSRNITAPQIPAQESQFIRKRSGDEAFARGSDIQASDLPNGTWKRRPTGPLEV